MSTRHGSSLVSPHVPRILGSASSALFVARLLGPILVFLLGRSLLVVGCIVSRGRPSQLFTRAIGGLEYRPSFRCVLWNLNALELLMDRTDGRRGSKRQRVKGIKGKRQKCIGAKAGESSKESNQSWDKRNMIAMEILDLKPSFPCPTTPQTSTRFTATQALLDTSWCMIHDA